MSYLFVTGGMLSISGVHMDIYYQQGAINLLGRAVVHWANYWQQKHIFVDHSYYPEKMTEPSDNLRVNTVVFMMAM